jgi:hypothetical protein
VRQAAALREVNQPPGRRRRARPDDLQAHVLGLLERLAAGDEGAQDEVAERAVLEHESAQRIGADGDVAHRPRDHCGEVGRLAREEADLADEADSRWRRISRPWPSCIAASPSMIAMKGKSRSPTR